jgi:hypothetical protein
VQRFCLESHLYFETPQYRGIADDRRNAMFTSTDFSQTTQRAVSMLMAAVIVAATFAIAAFVAQSAQPGYSVTITQLQ